MAIEEINIPESIHIRGRKSVEILGGKKLSFVIDEVEDKDLSYIIPEGKVGKLNIEIFGIIEDAS